MSLWFRFEGPGKLHPRRWHRVRPVRGRRFVTLCGRYVNGAPREAGRSPGTECANCRRAQALADRAPLPFGA